MPPCGNRESHPITLNEIMDSCLISTLYQPIVRLEDGAVIGYEALSRGPRDTEFESPMALLAEAERSQCLWDLEILLRRLAIERSAGLEEGQTLFLNVDPRIIKDPGFQQGLTREYLEAVSLKPSAIIFEITERYAIKDYQAFNRVLDNYREQGYQIAIDDAGAGYSGMHTIAVTQPNYVKIDMDIVRNVHSDPMRQAIVKSFVLLGQTANIRIIAEGIESREELKTLVRLGVYSGQGFYLQRPAPGIGPLDPEKIEEIRNISRMLQNQNAYSSHYHFIGSLATENETMVPDISCGDLEALFRVQGNEAFCMVRDGYMQGLVTRKDLFQSMSKLHGHALYERRPASLVMNTRPLTVDYYTSVSSVADEAMKRTTEKMYDPVVVLKGSRYHGMVSVRDLLQYSIEYEKDYARELNPLTQLPGNKVINRVLNDILVYSTQAAVFYFDLDNFKVYNDIYGFEKGDQVIGMLSRVIQNAVKGKDAINTFVGHIGGDDFVAVIENTETRVIHELCIEILDLFAVEIREFFTAEHLEAGWIEAEDRTGRLARYALTSLSIGVLYGKLTRIPDVSVLAEQMAVIKKGVKRIPGNAYQMFTLETFNQAQPEISRSMLKLVR